MTKKHLHFESQALRQRWPISDKMREAIVERLLRIIADKESSKREQLIAIKTLIAAESQNQADEHTAALQSDRNRFLEVAQQLGIDADFRLVGQEPTGSGDGSIDGPDGPKQAGIERHRTQADDEEQSG